MDPYKHVGARPGDSYSIQTFNVQGKRLAERVTGGVERAPFVWRRMVLAHRSRVALGIELTREAMIVEGRVDGCVVSPSYGNDREIERFEVGQVNDLSA